MDWHRQYFVLPNCCIAFNAKVASSALASSIAHKHYPDLLEAAKNRYDQTWSQLSDNFKNSLPDSFKKMLAEDWDSSKSFYQNVCPRTSSPDKHVLLLVRNPIDRFACTVAYMSIDVEDTIVALEKKEKRILDKIPCLVYRNTHFLPQHIYLDNNPTAYKYPDGLQSLCECADLDWPLRRINTGKNQKPNLTEHQMQRVAKIYEEDMKLFNSL
jgi:hypothetical protein